GRSRTSSPRPTPTPTGSCRPLPGDGASPTSSIAACPVRGAPVTAVRAADEALVRRALDVAARTPPGDVPVGALVLGPDGRELAAATNRREADGDPFAHAEVIALREAARVLGDGWRLEDCTLVVTLEPCTMCAGAAVAARVGRIVFGAWEPRTGACGSLWDV